MKDLKSIKLKSIKLRSIKLKSTKLKVQYTKRVKRVKLRTS